MGALLGPEEGSRGHFRSRLRVVLRRKKQFFLMGAGGFWSLFLERAFEDQERVRDEVARTAVQEKLERCLAEAGLGWLSGSVGLELREEGMVGW